VSRLALWHGRLKRQHPLWQGFERSAAPTVPNSAVALFPCRTPALVLYLIVMPMDALDSALSLEQYVVLATAVNKGPRLVLCLGSAASPNTCKFHLDPMRLLQGEQLTLAHKDVTVSHPCLLLCRESFVDLHHRVVLCGSYVTWRASSLNSACVTDVTPVCMCLTHAVHFVSFSKPPVGLKILLTVSWMSFVAPLMGPKDRKCNVCMCVYVCMYACLCVCMYVCM